ncbi:response regulator [Halofilum ochraceum]|uniref:response regulator n=1 Tax=Halofilum ochraceum TaxID=1611323 RepID=UPI0008D9DFF0|nr:response regulator transcription factor [Halofilum ochraceum]
MTTQIASRDAVRVILADDHDAVRSGIRDALDPCVDIAVVAEAADGDELLALAGSTRPDVALVDIALPGVDGLEATRRLVESGRGTLRVVILSVQGADASILGALQNGAAGFVLKSAGATEMELAVRAAARGENFLCPSIARKVIGAYLEHVDTRDDGTRRLTDRQRQVLELVAKGHTTKRIAQRLKISVKTVEAHRGELMRRLDVRNIAGLVQQAVRMGLLTL